MKGLQKYLRSKLKVEKNCWIWDWCAYDRGWTCRCFFNLQLWPLIFLQSLDQNQCLVPNMKDLFHTGTSWVSRIWFSRNLNIRGFWKLYFWYSCKRYSRFFAFYHLHFHYKMTHATWLLIIKYEKLTKNKHDAHNFYSIAGRNPV